MATTDSKYKVVATGRGVGPQGAVSTIELTDGVRTWLWTTLGHSHPLPTVGEFWEPPPGTNLILQEAKKK